MPKTRPAETRLIHARIPIELYEALTVELHQAQASSANKVTLTDVLISRLNAVEKRKLQEPVGRIEFPDVQSEMSNQRIFMPTWVKEKVTSNAKAFGVSNSRYVSNVLQSVISRPVVIELSEVLLVRGAMRELSAIGRNINQIAHRVNTELRFGGVLQTDVEIIKTAFTAIEPRLAALKRAFGFLLRARERTYQSED